MQGGGIHDYLRISFVFGLPHTDLFVLPVSIALHLRLAYFWYEDGTLHQRRNFYKGNQFGLHQEWSTGGDLIEDKLYSKGQAQN